MRIPPCSLIRLFSLSIFTSIASVLLYAQSPLDASMLTTADFPADCKIITGEFPVDNQTYIFAQYPDYQKQLLPPLKEKKAQSLDCSGNKGTIYYFQYSKPDDLGHVNAFLRPLLWGESHPTDMHPELIIEGGSVVAIASFHHTPDALQNALRKKLGDTSAPAAPTSAVSAVTAAPKPSAGEAEFQAGGKAFTDGDFPAAERHFRKAVAADPDHILAQFFLGESLFREQKYKEAVSPYEAAVRLDDSKKSFDQTQRRVLNDELGMAYGISGDFKKAKTHFDSSIAADPDYALYRYNLACTYAEMNDLPGTITALREALKRKNNVLQGETFPDPKQDDSFQRFLNNAEFKKLLAEYGY